MEFYYDAAKIGHWIYIYQMIKLQSILPTTEKKMSVIFTFPRLQPCFVPSYPNITKGPHALDEVFSDGSPDLSRRAARRIPPSTRTGFPVSWERSPHYGTYLGRPSSCFYQHGSWPRRRLDSLPDIFLSVVGVLFKLQHQHKKRKGGGGGGYRTLRSKKPSLQYRNLQ